MASLGYPKDLFSFLSFFILIVICFEQINIEPMQSMWCRFYITKSAYLLCVQSVSLKDWVSIYLFTLTTNNLIKISWCFESLKRTLTQSDLVNADAGEYCQAYFANIEEIPNVSANRIAHHLLTPVCLLAIAPTRAIKNITIFV